MNELFLKGALTIAVFKRTKNNLYEIGNACKSILQRFKNKA